MRFHLLNLRLNKQTVFHYEESLLLQMNDTCGHSKKTHLSSN